MSWSLCKAERCWRWDPTNKYAPLLERSSKTCRSSARSSAGRFQCPECSPTPNRSCNLASMQIGFSNLEVFCFPPSWHRPSPTLPLPKTTLRPGPEKARNGKRHRCKARPTRQPEIAQDFEVRLGPVEEQGDSPVPLQTEPVWAGACLRAASRLVEVFP